MSMASAWPAVSIRAPREGGDVWYDFRNLQGDVSIRAPREGGDFAWHTIRLPICEFQSAPPAKGATA